MNNQEIKFHNLFLDRGGIFKTEDGLMKDILDMAEDLKYFLKERYHNIPNIYINFIANKSLNAAAGLLDGEYFIGINIGTYFLIGDMFNKIFATNDVLLDIGNPRLETKDKKILSARLENNTIEYDFEGGVNNVLTPVDPTRKNVGSLFTTWMMEFLIFHELGHILRGHLNYKLEAQGLFS